MSLTTFGKFDKRLIVEGGSKQFITLVHIVTLAKIPLLHIKIFCKLELGKLVTSTLLFAYILIGIRRLILCVLQRIVKRRRNFVVGMCIYAKTGDGDDACRLIISLTNTNLWFHVVGGSIWRVLLV